MRDVPDLRLVVDNRSSSVSDMPRSRAARMRSKKNLVGMPRDGQLPTADGVTSRMRATTDWPPKRLRISETAFDIRRKNHKTGAYVNNVLLVSRRIPIRDASAYLTQMQAATPKPLAISESDLLRQQIGQRLRIVRRALGFHSANAMAKQLGLTNQRYGNYERGERFPAEAAIIELGRMGASLDFLFMGIGAPLTDRRSK